MFPDAIRPFYVPYSFFFVNTPMTDLFISNIEPLLAKKIIYRYYNISELITKPAKLKMLYIGRKGEWRQILNEKEIIGNITTKCGDVVEFVKTQFDRKTHRSRILSMRSTNILFGYHGAAFVNIMLIMPYSGLIEVFSPISRPRVLWYYGDKDAIGILVFDKEYFQSVKEATSWWKKLEHICWCE